MGEHEAEPLKLVRIPPQIVLDHVVASRLDGTLLRLLGHQVEIVFFGQRDDVINDSARAGILSVRQEDAGVDPLRDQDVPQADRSIAI